MPRRAPICGCGPPTAQSVSVNLYRKGGGGVCIGTLPLSPWGQGVWGVYLPGDQHGKYYDFTRHPVWHLQCSGPLRPRGGGEQGAQHDL